MCGYFGNLHECPEVLEILMDLDIPLPYPKGQFYQRRRVEGLVTQEAGGYNLSNAIWWFAQQWKNGQWQVNDRVTSFNARNLNAPLWRDSLACRRAIVFASEVGESQNGRHYLMKSTGGIALGALYKDWIGPTGEQVRSMAVITLPPHERFSQYHAKSTPAFLPLDYAFIQHWLDPEIAMSDAIQSLLSTPRLYQDLQVMAVKSFKRAEPLGEMEILERDD